jgi:predicted small secreted protein
MTRRILASLLVMSFAIGLSACGDTWRGVKKDTGDNMEATGGAIENAGEKVKN